jgi:acyl-CoA reductase-like NAD-dependent aldehyde dehydrogenase
LAELTVFSAYDQQPMGAVPRHDRETCLRFLAEARALSEDRAGWLPVHQRLSILKNAATLIAQRAEELAVQAAREGGKPLLDSRVEVARAIEGIETAIAVLRTEGGREIPMSLSPSSVERFAVTYREPRGPVVAISAFNHPFNLIIHQVVPAVAVGAPVLVKPASATPLSCRALVEILLEAGLPEAWCRVVHCDNETTRALVAHPATAFLSFIGSARVGWMLRALLSPGASCALEHGGLAPVIVDESADLADAIPRLVKGGFYHAGQVCVSVQRIFVHASILDDFVARFVKSAQALQVGDPLDPTTEVGPLIHPDEVERVASWVTEAVDAGARLGCGGQKLGSTTYAPTVLIDPPDDVQVSTEEIFGPVVCVYGYEHVSEAIARATRPDSYFQAAVFTQKYEAALTLSRQLRGMAVMVNDHTAFRVDWMPFGGQRNSGMGVGGIGSCMKELTVERMVVFRAPGL